MQHLSTFIPYNSPIKQNQSCRITRNLIELNLPNRTVRGSVILTRDFQVKSLSPHVWLFHLPQISREKTTASSHNMQESRPYSNWPSLRDHTVRRTAASGWLMRQRQGKMTIMVNPSRFDGILISVTQISTTLQATATFKIQNFHHFVAHKKLSGFNF